MWRVGEELMEENFEAEYGESGDSCSTCRFFDEDELFVGGGQCRRRAPPWYLLGGEVLVPSAVGGGEWCGEFEEGKFRERRKP